MVRGGRWVISSNEPRRNPPAQIMSPEKRTIWFPAKTHGWGWSPPVCWRGWVVIMTYLLLLAGGAYVFPMGRLGFVFYVIGLSVALTAVCWLKGEKPAWRWGKKDER